MRYPWADLPVFDERFMGGPPPYLGNQLPGLMEPPPVFGTAPNMPMATVGIDRNFDGRPDVMLSGVDMNRDGIPDVLQRGQVFGTAPNMPMATVGIDRNFDGRPDVMLSGVDMNRDGIPDVL
jgi:hypothetical protein